MTIQRLLVANRGEIARRVFRTCRNLGIGTVAVHSDADAGLAIVREADVAVRLPGSAPVETYLRGDLLVQAALDAGADAVHPGYGFLSESADFARQVLAAGLVWVGPTPRSMELMASKVRAKALMAAASVPVLPELSPAEVTEADLPLIVKASAGGGGRGMRVVRTLDALDRAVQQASAEALSSFGDAEVFCEPYLERGRHVEVQLLGDTHGTVVVLGDRDCSVQRRHQKILEEAPAPHLPDAVRAELHRAARTAGQAVGYVGAGTVEFLVEGGTVLPSGGSPGGNPPGVFFLEMNTRLQVEHPVTELVTGLDLVELQLLVAEGGRVPEPPAATGHAVEARLYAEDPARDWQPQSGRLTRFEVDHDAAFGPLAGPGVRLDTGFGSGDEVGTHYDAMLAKVVCWAPTRIHGLRTNRDLLVEVLRNDEFVAGGAGTDFLARASLQELDRGSLNGSPVQRGLLLFAAAVATAEVAAADRPVQRGVPTGWRNVVSAPQVTTFDLDGTEVRVGWLGDHGGYRLVDLHGEVHGAEVPGAEVRAAEVTRVERGAGPLRVPVRHRGLTHTFDVYVEADRMDVESPLGHVSLTRRPRLVDPADRVASGSLLAPMPGTVVRIDVEPGARVTAGQPVLVLEAMKMQHTITAPHDGEVDELAVGVGSHVAAGAVLAVVRILTHEGET
jgi:propionyl-CoA carboxylase alpha chain